MEIILLLEPRTGKTLDAISGIRRGKDDTVMMYSRTIVNRVRQEGAAIMISDTSREDQHSLSDSKRLMQIKSFMCVPLISGDQMRGVVYVDSVNKPVGFRKEDLLVLNALGSPVGLAIENASLQAVLKKR